MKSAEITNNAKTKRWPRWIENQLVRRGITDERVLAAFAQVSRASFAPRRFRDMAEADSPIRIGCRQTVSQPYVIALSLQALELTGTERVLDVGTGSGYQAVLLSCLAREVFTIEIHERLYFNARMTIENRQHAPVYTRLGDGSVGWPEQAPFDAIVVGSRAGKVPDSLIQQLAPGGRMVIPVGGESVQGLYQIIKLSDGSLKKRILERVLFVPLLGKQGSGRFPE